MEPPIRRALATVARSDKKEVAALALSRNGTDLRCFTGSKKVRGFFSERKYGYIYICDNGYVSLYIYIYIYE